MTTTHEETTMQTLQQISDAELKGLQIRTDECIAEQERLMATTPRDTVAYAAMEASRPGLLSFRCRVDDELDRRGF